MRSRYKPALLAVAVTLSACGDKTGLDAEASIVGTWDVQSVNGTALPWSETQTDQGITCTFTLNTMAITFTSSHTYNGTMSISIVCPGQQPFHLTEGFGGTYSISGNQITMTETGETEGSVSTFSISGSTLTLGIDDDGGITTIVARRR